jgi:His-Xaa-Ser system radical SAM maturase HxsC
MAELVRRDIAKISSGYLSHPIYVLGREPIGTSELVSGLIDTGEGDFQCTRSGSKISSSEINAVADPGDVFFLNRAGNALRTALSKRAAQNTLLVTEQCDNNCTFCSQPPRETPDYYDLAMAALSEFDGLGVVGISGGEPTMHWEKFIRLLSCESAKHRPLHVLTHGRVMSREDRVREMQEHGITNAVLFGIPVHGSSAQRHDAVTGIRGSWSETIQGLINLRHINAALEIRIIITEQILDDLDSLLAFLHASLGSSGYRVALMRLEPKGWARGHLNLLRPSIAREAAIVDHVTLNARVRGQNISLYNYPLCLISKASQRFAHKSISDWKNVFPEKCKTCILKSGCCGLFDSERSGVVEQLRPLI